MKPTYEELEKKCALQQSKLSAINELMGVVEKASDIAKAGIEELQSQNANLAVQLANAESKCRELAAVVAENAALKTAAKETLAHWAAAEAGEMELMMDKCMPALRDAYCETPATDAFLAEVRASGIDEMAVEYRKFANKDGCSCNMQSSYNLTAERAESYAAYIRRQGGKS